MAQVLVVDDDESVARLVADVVAFCKHTPEIFDDPFMAILAIRSQRFGAVLTDYMMPKLDGIELLLVTQEASPHTRRVLITAGPSEDEVKEAARTGVAQMVIAKPPGIAEIRLALSWL
jgi:two-component system chemotaxis response regulator CheY